MHASTKTMSFPLRCASAAVLPPDVAEALVAGLRSRLVRFAPALAVGMAVAIGTATALTRSS